VIPLAAPFLLLAVQAAAQEPAAIAITHVTVIDGTDSLPRRDRTVILRGARITAVGPASRTAVPRSARVLDGRGKYLVPGFWDMHVHTDVPAAREVLPLYVANGVTGVRDMGGDWTRLTALRALVRSGRLLGPRLLLSGPYLDGNDQPIAHLPARSPAEAVAAVDSLAALGVDLVKLHTGLTRETFFAAARAARGKQLPFAGHVPRVVGAADASDSGMSSIEHLLTIPTPCTPAESLALQPRFTVQGALGRCSSADPAPLYARLARNGTRVTPTFVAQYEVALWPERRLPGDSFARYLPDTLRRFVAAIFPMPDSVPPGADSVGRAVFAKRLALVGALHRAGVGILAGTDAPLRNSPPGFGLHEELVWLARAGLSPFEVLRAATLDAARFLGMQDSLGTVAPGQLADLVLLDADPLADIRNTRRVGAVVANGRLLDGAARRALLHRARAGAGASPSP
jgi:imidazolonepropionase-like amidohydrolase